MHLPHSNREPLARQACGVFKFNPYRNTDLISAFPYRKEGERAHLRSPFSLSFHEEKEKREIRNHTYRFRDDRLCDSDRGGWFVRQDYLFGQTADGFIIRQRVRPGTPVTLVYRHSVQKTMIHEYLEVNDMATGLVLKSTKYQSMGVGLPFSKEDGDFREEDGWFILDNMNRPYPELSIRNGVTNEEKVYVGDTEYDLASLMPLGKELHLYVAPLYQVLYKKKEIRS